MSRSETKEKNNSMRKKIDTALFTAAATAIQKYRELFPHCHIEQDSGYELLRYREGEFYTQHVDSFTAKPRTVSCTFALNDAYEGGTFAFFDNTLGYTLSKGSALLFPSNFMYPHEVRPVTRGVRYSVVTWFA